MTPANFLDALYHYGYQFITGVPDSLFKHLITAVKADGRFQHVITNNEGESCALAAGYHLATGKIPVVYLQNSGLGNCINPLTSLLDEWIYAIPALLLIGWRAKPGEPDEPQHRRMGAILLDLLTLLAIPYVIVDEHATEPEALFEPIQLHFSLDKKPLALVFTQQALKTPTQNQSMTRVDAIEHNTLPLREQLLEYMVSNSQPHYLFVTTTGKTSRELYEIRDHFQQTHDCDFLTVGSMGCASSIALGIAMQQPQKRVIVVDGDGACLMRMEALATIGHVKPSNLLHVLIDNNAYESTGAQQTQSHQVDFAAIALACGYQHGLTVSDLGNFAQNYLNFTQGPTLLVVKSMPFSRTTLGRPKTTPVENKLRFMKQLGVN